MNRCRGRTADTWAGFELVDPWMVLLLSSPEIGGLHAVLHRSWFDEFVNPL